MKVQGKEELGAGLQRVEERAGAERDGDRRDIWALGVRDRGGAKNALLDGSVDDGTSTRTGDW